MSKNQNTNQKQIGAANMLRFYDTGLIERLNKRSTKAGTGTNTRIISSRT